MKNSEYFYSEEDLIDAWNKRNRYSGDYNKGYTYWIGQMMCYPELPYSQLKYAISEADTGFEYDIGEIVMFEGEYDIVDEYNFDRKASDIGCFNGIVMRHHGTQIIPSRLENRRKFKSNIPNDVVELIRSAGH